jgi:osmoprotectant transport system substrate-binding protein
MGGCSRVRPLTVGSKSRTDHILLGEILAQHIERRLKVRVIRGQIPAGTLLSHQSLLVGDIDLCPEYTGAALMAVLGLPADSDRARVLQRVRNEYASRFRLSWIGPLGFDDGFALVIRAGDARRRNIKTLSQASGSQPGWVMGVTHEYLGRSDGYPEMMRAYAIPLHGAPKALEPAELYPALSSGKVDMVSGNTTDGMLSSAEFTVLEDDKAAFPPYEAGIVVRQESLATYPGLQQALDELTGRFSHKAIQRFDYEIDGRHRKPAEGAREFLQQAGL